jgi:hypothetical protein
LEQFLHPDNIMTGKSKVTKKSKKSGGTMKMGYGPLQQVQRQALRVVFPWTRIIGYVEAVVNTGSTYSFALNSCFDPDVTGVGSQPLGFDQYSALYGRYRVIKVRYEVTFISTSASYSNVGLYTSPIAAIPADFNAWSVMNPTAKHAVLGQAVSGTNKHVFSGTIDLATLFGITPPELRADQDFSAVIGANPTRLAYLHVWASGSAVVASGAIYLRMWQETELSQPVALSLS